MCQQKAPAAPDPRQTSAASTSTNVGTAIANSMMNNVNQVTPSGALNYSQSGTYKWNDPYTGQTYDIPQYTATQTLSPQGQATQDQLDGASYNLASISNDRSKFLTDYLGKEMDTSSLPGLVSNANQTGTIGGGYDTNFSRDIGGNYTNTVDLTNTYQGADDFSADRQRVEDALWQRGAASRAQEDESLRTRLLNSGLREGSAAWNAEMERLGRQTADERIGTMLASGQEQSRLVGLSRDAAQFSNDANLTGANFGNNASLTAAQYGSSQQQAQNAAGLAGSQFSNNANLTNAQFQNAARGQGLQEAYAARAQPLNEIIGLMGGSQVQQPNFVNTNTSTIPTTDVAGIINTNYQQQMDAWKQQQAASGGLLSGIGSGIGSLLAAPSKSILGGLIASDDNIKKNKERLGDIKGEMGLWSFNYNNEPDGAEKHIGLMASEVQKEKPSAVKKGKDGIRRVDYGKALK